MRKTSAYARRMKHDPKAGYFNAAEWLNTISRCRSFNEPEPIPGSWLPGTAETAERMKDLVQGSLDRLISGQVKPNETDPFDMLAHAIGVSVVRSNQTKGDRTEAAEVLWLAKTALNSVKARWQRLGKWGATRPEQLALQSGVDLYVQFLESSSPEQMKEAANLRMDILKAQGWVDPEQKRKAA